MAKKDPNNDIERLLSTGPQSTHDLIAEFLNQIANEDETDDDMMSEDIDDDEVDAFWDNEGSFWGGDGSNLLQPVRVHVEAALIPSTGDYAPPLDQLMHLGSLTTRNLAQIDERLAPIGLTQEHVPELIRMSRDRDLNSGSGDTDEVWAPIYALLALKHLDVRAHLTELIPLYDLDSDWVGENIGNVIAGAGPVAVEPVRQYLEDRSHWVFGHARAIDTLEKIAQQHPALRDQIIAILCNELEQTESRHPAVNGFVLVPLLHLKATEALPAIRRAFEQNRIDETIAGDWEEVLKELKQPIDPSDPLIQQSRAHAELTRSSMWPWSARRTTAASQAHSPTSARKKSKATEKNKRKMASATRKANQRKKKKK